MGEHNKYYFCIPNCSNSNTQHRHLDGLKYEMRFTPEGKEKFARVYTSLFPLHITVSISVLLFNESTI